MSDEVQQIPSLILYSPELDQVGELFWSHEVEEFRIDFGDKDFVPELGAFGRRYDGSTHDWIVIGKIDPPNPELRL